MVRSTLEIIVFQGEVLHIVTISIVFLFAMVNYQRNPINFNVEDFSKQFGLGLITIIVWFVIHILEMFVPSWTMGILWIAVSIFCFFCLVGLLDGIKKSESSEPSAPDDDEDYYKRK